jgi:hypothetical protein
MASARSWSSPSPGLVEAHRRLRSLRPDGPEREDRRGCGGGQPSGCPRVPRHDRLRHPGACRSLTPRTGPIAIWGTFTPETVFGPPSPPSAASGRPASRAWDGSPSSWTTRSRAGDRLGASGRSTWATRKAHPGAARRDVPLSGDRRPLRAELPEAAGQRGKAAGSPVQAGMTASGALPAWPSGDGEVLRTAWCLVRDCAILASSANPAPPGLRASGNRRSRSGDWGVG